MFMVVFKITPVKTIINIIFECSFLLLVFSKITFGDNTTICGHPAVPINSQVLVSSEKFTVGSTAMYKCDEGYELFGSHISKCLGNGSWSTELPFCGVNIAIRKPANQSSTVRGGSATNANDGEKTTVHDGKRCTETMKELSPWWQVDLLKPYPIRIIRITTRGCCGHQPIQDLEIHVGNYSSEFQRNPLCAWFPGTIDEGSTKSFTCARMLTGQYVFLRLGSAERSLSLCEVEVFTTEEFSNDHCALFGVSSDVEYTSFNQTCYEFNIGKGSSFNEARWECQKSNGGLIHNFNGVTTAFIIAELERRKEKLKTHLVWIGALKDPGLTSKIWKWINGEVVGKPSWGKDQPNNYNGEQNCVVLDGGRNWLWNDVGCNLDYLNWICQYKPAFCGSANKNVNTKMIMEDKHIGAVIHYDCPDDYVLIGDKNRTCTENGLWSGEAPSCSYVNCGNLSDIENGFVIFSSNKTTYGAEVLYKCAINYTLVGPETRTCTEDGTWTDREPQCLYDWCPDPPEIQSGLISVIGKRVGSKAVYTCLPGYALSGHQELLCDVGGKWAGKRPSCQYIDCGLPSAIDNGQYNMINSSSTYNSIVEYTCNRDYWLEPLNHSHQICTREGKWFPETPFCELITCGEPDVPPGGYVVGYDFNIHSKIEFHCEPGYLLFGQTVLICTEKGEWNGTSPNCQYIDCGRLPSLLYGSVNYSNNFTYLDSEVTYSCAHNYKLTGSSVRKCLETGNWSGISPKCEEIRCLEPILPPHSIISVTGNDRVYGRTLIRTSNDASSFTTYKIGALVKYRCERGYKILGSSSSTCEEIGQWSGDVPHCVYVDCGAPENIQHGSLTLASNVTYYGSAALYECEAFYELDGHARRLCLENGSWSSDPPKCKEIVCKEPIVNEDMTLKINKYTVGGIAYYTCEKGFNMEGNSTRECHENGTWSGKIPICKPVTCEYPGSVQNGRVIVINQSVNYDSVIEYHCAPHYERVGPYSRKCMDNGEWSESEPKCEMKMTLENNEDRVNAYIVSIGVGALFLLLIFGVIYLKLRKAVPIKNAENVQEINKKEEEETTVMSYASLSDSNVGNIYEHIPGNEDGTYDTPYEGLEHYESSPISTRGCNIATVTINGVALR